MRTPHVVGIRVVHVVPVVGTAVTDVLRLALTPVCAHLAVMAVGLAVEVVRWDSSTAFGEWAQECVQDVVAHLFLPHSLR